MDIEDFWQDAPDVVLEVEEAWNEFVDRAGGERVDKYLSKSPQFDNADYIFPDDNVIIELKEIQTEFSGKPAFLKKFDALMKKLMKENPEYRPFQKEIPHWFYQDYLRIFRPPLARTLKNANKQIKETKEHFNIKTPSGIAVFVNEGFVSVTPDKIIALASNILTHSYSSIDCFIYVSVNRYVAAEGSDEPKLLWVPVYSDRIDDSIYDFANSLGKKWFDYFEDKVGSFTSREQADDGSFLQKTSSIVLPSEY